MVQVKRVKWLLCGVAAGAALIGSAAYAQDTDAKTASSSGRSGFDDTNDIVVTARKREETLQSVPIAVTALNGEMLAERGYSSVTDMEQVVPGLRFTSGGGGNSNAFNAYIRGVGEGDFIVTSDPAVALYIDGVYVARSFGADLGLNDIERVEVLRGPQGSLFGKNTIGGAINVVTRLPDGTPRFNADLRAGSFKSLRFRVNAEFPLGENLSASVSGLYRRAEGWQKTPGPNNNLGDENAITGRLKLRWHPDGGPDIVFSADALHQRQRGRPHNTVANKLSAPFAALSAPFFGPCCEITDDPDVFAAPSPYNHDDSDAYNLSLTATFPIGTGELKSITAYRNVDALFGRGINSINPNFVGDFHDERSRQFSQELQYSNSLWDDRVELIVGAYYFRERSLDHTNLFVTPGLATHPGFPAFLQMIGIPAPPFVFDLNLDFDNRQTTKNYAAFGNITVNITDALSLDLGGRYTHEKKRFYQKATRTEVNMPLIPQAPEYTLHDSWNSFTPKATLSYQITPTVLTYATYSKGYRSGGFNGRPTQFAEIGSYEPETLVSWEAGLKSTFLNGRARFNLAAYTNKYRNQQVLVVGLASDGITIVASTDNSGRSHMRGFEMESSFQATDWLSIDGALSYLDAGYDEYVSNGVDRSNLKLRNAPKWTGNAGINLKGEVSDGMTARARLDGSYVSKLFVDTSNTPELSSGDYWILNANVGLEWDSGWSLQATAENFTDRRKIVGGSDLRSAFGIVEAYFTPPARYYLTVGYRF